MLFPRRVTPCELQIITRLMYPRIVFVSVRHQYRQSQSPLVSRSMRGWSLRTASPNKRRQANSSKTMQLTRSPPIAPISTFDGSNTNVGLHFYERLPVATSSNLLAVNIGERSPYPSILLYRQTTSSETVVTSTAVEHMTELQ
jgi:hypothetical protein